MNRGGRGQFSSYVKPRGYQGPRHFRGNRGGGYGGGYRVGGGGFNKGGFRGRDGW